MTLQKGTYEQIARGMEGITLMKAFYNLLFAAVVLFLVGILAGYFIDMKIAQAVQFCAILALVFACLYLIRFNVSGAYFVTLFGLLMLWYSFVILRGIDLSYASVKRYLFSEFTFWSFVVPFAAFLPKTSLFIKVMFRWFYALGFVFLVFTLATFKWYGENYGIAEQGIWAFATGSGFVLLTWKYHSNMMKALAVIVLLVAILVATVLARRNVMLTYFNFLAASYVLYFFYYSRRDGVKKVVAGAVLACLLAGTFLFFLVKKDDYFKLIVSRAREDTREYVFDYYFDDVKKVMWTGKGIDGTYYCPLSIPGVEPVEDRDLIECGYLQMILKGGYISVILFLMIALPAAYLGIFKSRNGFSKACGILILLWLIDMIPYGIPSWSLRYFLVWFAIGVCYSPSVRFLNENYFTGTRAIRVRRRQIAKEELNVNDSALVRVR